MTTAIYPNRKFDKVKLETELKLLEQGDERTEFYCWDVHGNKVLVAKGYTRIVYGDHGPYIEFEERHMLRALVDKFGRPATRPYQLPSLENAKFYYYWLAPTSTTLKVYLQIKPVSDLPNSPPRKDGKYCKYNRTEGYADYKRGMYYIDPYDLCF